MAERLRERVADSSQGPVQIEGAPYASVYADRAARCSTDELTRRLAGLPQQAVVQRHAIVAELRARGIGPSL